MSQDLRISIIKLDLTSLNFNVDITEDDNRNTEDTINKKLNIDYDIENDNTVKFDVYFKFSELDFKIEGSYLFVIRLNNVNEIPDFIKNNKEDLIFPIYSKISQMIATLTDQTSPFPLIVPPSIWIDEDENE